MVCNRKSYSNGWFRGTPYGTPILGNPYFVPMIFVWLSHPLHLETRTGFATIHRAGAVALAVDMSITIPLDGGVDGVMAPPMCTTTLLAGAEDGVMALRSTTIMAMAVTAGATVLPCIIAMVGVRCEVWAQRSKDQAVKLCCFSGLEGFECQSNWQRGVQTCSWDGFKTSHNPPATLVWEPKMGGKTNSGICRCHELETLRWFEIKFWPNSVEAACNNSNFGDPLHVWLQDGKPNINMHQPCQFPKV